MTLWIPPSALSKTGQTLKCLTCGADNADEDHVISCSKAHEDVEHHMVYGDKSVFNGKPVDVELEAWVDKYRKPLLEGRMKI